MNRILRKKLAQIKANMKYRTKQECPYTIDELFNKFSDWENHGKTWNIDHKHPVCIKELYCGCINSLENLQKLTILEHKNKNVFDLKEKRMILGDELKIKWKTISEQKIYNIIENWDFTVNGKITQRSIQKNNSISKKTIEKYWPSFKEYIKELNKKELHLQSKPKKDEIKEKTNTDNKRNGTGIQPICSNTRFTDDSLCEIQLSKNLKTNSETPSSVWPILNQPEMDI